MRTRVTLAIAAACAVGYVASCNGPKEGSTKAAKHTATQQTSLSDPSHHDQQLTARESSARASQEQVAQLLEQMPLTEQCRGSNRLFVTPRAPEAGQRLRIIALLDHPPDATSVQLWNEDGAPIKADETDTLGGPPHGHITTIAAPLAGRITVAISRRGKLVACDAIEVEKDAADEKREFSSVWPVKTSWNASYETLWAFFIEALFDYPVDDTRTWTNLHDLIQERKRNILYDYHGQGEDESLTLEPDCADLPYQLRAYFAWKLGLPFAFRWCSRGGVGEPPKCGRFRTNEMERERSSNGAAFEHFAQRVVRPGVHSASGRTHPKDNETDLYPVALERTSLAPGTVYADPHGHVMILTQWIAQQGDESGILMAAEAQPDGTVGRRRFWRGSFLFDPDTTHVGAGFKVFRPIEKRDGKLLALDNASLKGHPTFADFSLQQYEITREHFYDEMDALINPEPLNPDKRLLALVDAFDESVQRRVTAVQNGEDYVTAHGSIDMPHGHAIFETSGPWEDYSTPSRDMRLLISLDTVTNFVDRVRRHPERFNVKDAEVERTVNRLRGFLRKELEARNIEYIRSDGQKHSLTLWQVLRRAKSFEMAYNPNDCIEIRWGAPADTHERASCERRASEAHQERMNRYRIWFAERTRPARGTE